MIITHDSYFRLDIRICRCLRNLYLRSGICVQGYGRYMQIFWFTARYRYTLYLSQLVSTLSAQPVLKRAVTVHQSQIGPSRFKAGQLASNRAKLRFGP